MRFPQYDYREYNNSNKLEHPKPWTDMIAEAEQYCKELKYPFDFEGKCRDVDVPSFHPYWKFQVFKRTLELIDCTRGSIAESEKFIQYNPNHSRANSAKIMIRNQKKSIEFYCSKLI